MTVTAKRAPDIVALVKLPHPAAARAIELSLEAARLQLAADLAPTRVAQVKAAIAAEVRRRAAALALALIRGDPDA